jgi:hypothetical protein
MKSIFPAFLFAAGLTLAALAPVEFGQIAAPQVTVDPSATPKGTSTSPSAKTHPASEVRVIKRVPVTTPAVPSVLPPKPTSHSTIGKKITDITPPASVVAAKKIPTGPVGALVAPLGLPMLKPSSTGGAALMIASKYEVDPLDVAKGSSGVRKGQQASAGYLAIDGGKVWSRPLRGKPTDVVFVSFVVNAAQATTVKVGGAWLRVDESARMGYAEIMIGEPDAAGAVEWKKLNYEIRLGVFGAQELAILPVLTVRIDPAAGVWDLFSGTWRVAGARAMMTVEKPDARKFALEAGPGGAWLCGFVACDENPLFADANLNGVPDEFELARHGALASVNALPADQRTLGLEWQLGAPRSPPAVMRFPRPAPDRLITAKTQP